MVIKASPNREQMLFLVAGGVILLIILVVVVFNMNAESPAVATTTPATAAKEPPPPAAMPAGTDAWMAKVTPAPVFDQSGSGAGQRPMAAPAGGVAYDQPTPITEPTRPPMVEEAPAPSPPVREAGTKPRGGTFAPLTLTPVETAEPPAPAVTPETTRTKAEPAATAASLKTPATTGGKPAAAATASTKTTAPAAATTTSTSTKATAPTVATTSTKTTAPAAATATATPPTTSTKPPVPATPTTTPPTTAKATTSTTAATTASPSGSYADIGAAITNITGKRTPTPAQTASVQPAPAAPATVKTTAPLPATTVTTAKAAPTAPAAEPSGSGSYIISLGAFKDANNAAALQQRVASLGMPVYRENVAVSGASYVRIKVGPYKSRSEADKALRALSGNLGINGSVTASGGN